MDLTLLTPFILCALYAFRGQGLEQLYRFLDGDLAAGNHAQHAGTLVFLLIFLGLGAGFGGAGTGDFLSIGRLRGIGKLWGWRVLCNGAFVVVHG